MAVTRQMMVRPRRFARAIRSESLYRLARADEVLSRALDTVHRRHTLLAYRRSHIGGVTSKHAEQWDYFDGESGCGTFQYRARTRKLRKVG